MRLFALFLALLVPVVTTAQSSGPLVAVAETNEPVPLDVLPVAAPALSSSTLVFITIGAALGLSAFLLAISDGESVGNACLAAGGTALVCGGLGTAFAICHGMELLPSEESPPLDEATARRHEAAQAFADDRLTVVQREELAVAARASGHGGIVLQRLVIDERGVGEAGHLVRLEVAVVDAETAQFLPLGEGGLVPATTLSVSIDGGWQAARAEALHQVETALAN